MEATLVDVVSDVSATVVMEEDVVSPFPFVVVVIYTTFIIVLDNAFIIGSKIDNSVDFVGNCIDLATFNIMGVVVVNAISAYLYCNFIVEVVVVVLKNHNLNANATVVITKEVVTMVNYINP